MSKFISVWDYELLWAKCKVYANRALAEPRESHMFPFWSSLLLEFVGRATLAKVHPVLLADPQNGDNTLYVFGFSRSDGPPKSIVAKTVFDRCTKIVPDFTKKELESCLKLVERRNEELHSGSAAYEGFKTSAWLADYFKACKILLTYQGRTLDELFGKDEEESANEMISEADETITHSVLARIAKIKKDFSALPEAERNTKIQEGSIKADASVKYHTKTDDCICCSAKGLLGGKQVAVSEDKLEGGDIVYERIILPTSFTCYSCGLKLNSHQELMIGGYGGQFAEKEVWDPVEYYGLDTSEKAVEPDYDYGND